jgi:hypothetical protein
MERLLNVIRVVWMVTVAMVVALLGLNVWAVMLGWQPPADYVAHYAG